MLASFPGRKGFHPPPRHLRHHTATAAAFASAWPSATRPCTGLQETAHRPSPRRRLLPFLGPPRSRLPCVAGAHRHPRILAGYRLLPRIPVTVLAEVLLGLHRLHLHPSGPFAPAAPHLRISAARHLQTVAALAAVDLRRYP